MTSRLRAYVGQHHVALLALFFSLGLGSAWAATELSKNEVKSKHIGPGQVERSDIAKNAVNSRKVSNGSLTAGDFAAGQIPSGAQGPTGPTGPEGTTGQDADKAFGWIRDDGTETSVLQFGSGIDSAEEVPGSTQYRVDFTDTVQNCAILVEPGVGSPTGGTTLAGGTPGSSVQVQDADIDPTDAYVTFEFDMSFFIAAFC